MSFGIILLIWTGLNLYLLARLLSVPVIARHVPLPVVIPVFVVVAASYLTARLTKARHIAGFPRTLEFIGAQWIGMVFLLFAAFLAVDLVTGFGFLFRAFVPALRTDALVCAVVLMVIAAIQAQRAPAVTAYEFILPGLPRSADGLVLLAASDLHLGLMLGHGWASRLAEQFAMLRPDIILFVGDIFEDEASTYAGWLPVLQRFQAPHGVFFVTGNHELYAGAEKILDLMRRAGFRVLRDASAEPIPGLVITGVDDAAFRKGKQKQANMVERTLAERPSGATVFLSHRPAQAELAARAGVKLMLSGHTHKGQIWPFQYLTRTAFRLVAGRYDVDGTTAIVGRGTGTWGPRMRLWQRGEIIKITLRSDAPVAHL